MIASHVQCRTRSDVLRGLLFCWAWTADDGERIGHVGGLVDAEDRGGKWVLVSERERYQVGMFVGDTISFRSEDGAE